MFKLIASLGATAIAIWLVVFCACAYVWFQGVLVGFHHSIIIGIVSIIPPVGFIEGILHLFGVI